MNITLRRSIATDLPFLKEIIYEAIFWRRDDKRSSFEEGSAYPPAIRALEDWGQREGDTAIIATQNDKPVGAAWYRYFTEDNYIRGYMDDKVPVLVIGVHEDYRHQGIGRKMMEWLIEHAKKSGIEKISLMVSMDNYALNLYKQQSFRKYSQDEDSFTMVREL